MISFNSEIEGKEARFGDIEDVFAEKGFVLGGNWEFDGGYFDTEVDGEYDETVYLRLPVQVVQGQLDEAEAKLRFLQPLLVRHVVNTGLAEDEPEPGTLGSSVVQFQPPLETDGEIHDQDKRLEKAKDAIQRILPYLH